MLRLTKVYRWFNVSLYLYEQVLLVPFISCAGRGDGKEERKRKHEQWNE